MTTERGHGTTRRAHWRARCVLVLPAALVNFGTLAAGCAASPEGTALLHNATNHASLEIVLRDPEGRRYAGGTLEEVYVGGRWLAGLGVKPAPPETEVGDRTHGHAADSDHSASPTSGMAGRWTSGLRWGRILEVMKTRSGAQRRHLSSSPFSAQPEPAIEQFVVGDRVTHDKYGLGRIVGEEDDAAVAVDFGSHRVRVASPFHKLTKL